MNWTAIYSADPLASFKDAPPGADPTLVLGAQASKASTALHAAGRAAAVPPGGSGGGRGVTRPALAHPQVNLWSEHVKPGVLAYAMWPRAAAAAERLWSRAEDTEVRLRVGAAAAVAAASCPSREEAVECGGASADALAPRLLPTQSAEAARPRLERAARQLAARGLQLSSLDWDGTNWRYELLPQARGLQHDVAQGPAAALVCAAGMLRKAPNHPPPALACRPCSGATTCPGPRWTTRGPITAPPPERMQASTCLLSRPSSSRHTEPIGPCPLAPAPPFCFCPSALRAPTCVLSVVAAQASLPPGPAKLPLLLVAPSSAPAARCSALLSTSLLALHSSVCACAP